MQVGQCETIELVKPALDLSEGISSLASVGRVRTRDRASDRVYDELVSAIREMRIP